MEGYGDKLRVVVNDILKEIKKLLLTSNDGKIAKEGIKTVILGKPNAGKSSLLNVLTGQERAIVTDVAGTTRDILEESIQLEGITLNVVDTAGIHNTQDIVEKIGVDRAKSSAESADLILYVIDASLPLNENDFEIINMIQEKRVIILFNKSDLSTVIDETEVKKWIKKPIVHVSAKQETGMMELTGLIKEMFYQGEISFNDEIYITNSRHLAALNDAYKSLEKVIESIDHLLSEDFYTIDLMDAYEALGRITGESMGEDLVNEIFSKFCVGK